VHPRLRDGLDALHAQEEGVDLLPDLAGDVLPHLAGQPSSLADGVAQRVRVVAGEDEEVAGGDGRIELTRGLEALGVPDLHVGAAEAGLDGDVVRDVGESRDVLGALQVAAQPVEVLGDATEHWLALDRGVAQDPGVLAAPAL
jgi:hypothetical protein